MLMMLHVTFLAWFYIPPLYYICVIGEVFSRSTHCSWSNPKSFWIAYSWDASFFGPIQFHSLCAENKPKNTSILWLSHYSLYCCSFTIFWRMKIFLGAQKFWIFYSFLNVLQFPIHGIQGQRPGTLLVPIISPLILYSQLTSYDRCSPDLHTVTCQTLYLFGSPSHGMHLFFGPSQFHSLCAENEPKFFF